MGAEFSATPGCAFKASTTLTSRLADYFNRHYWLCMAAILILALALRVVALLSLKETPYYKFLLIDESVYHQWAVQIAGGSYHPKAAYEFSPLPAYVMALVYRLLGPEVLYIRLLNIFFGALTCVLIGMIGTALFDRCNGVVSGFIAALYKPFILYSITPLKTSLSILLCAAVIYLLIAYLHKTAPLTAWLLGVILALALNVRGNYNIFIPISFLALLWALWNNKTSWKHMFAHCAFFALGLTLALVPFAFRNYLVAREFVLTTTQAGFNFYIGNNLFNKTPYYHPVPFASASPLNQGVEFTIEASRKSGKTLTASEASTFWINESFHQARLHPEIFLSKIACKTLAVLNRFEAFDHYDVDFMAQFIPLLNLPLFNFMFVWPLGLAGLAHACVQRSDARWLGIMLVSYLATLIIFFMGGRYRLPALVTVIPFVFAGIRSAVAYALSYQFKPVAAYLGMVVLFITVALLPIPGSGDQSLYHNLLASNLLKEGRTDEAISQLQASAQSNQTYAAVAHLSLAQISFRKGDVQNTRLHLEQISDNSHLAARKYALLGDLYLAVGDWSEAAEAFHKSLQINSSQADVRRKSISLLNSKDPAQTRREYRKMAEDQDARKGL